MLKFVLFQYSYTMDMDLYAIFETNAGDCIVSYFNVYCGGAKYSFPRNNKKQPRYNVLSLEQTGNFRYLFFVKVYNYIKTPPFNNTVIVPSPNVQMYNNKFNNNLASVQVFYNGERERIVETPMPSLPSNGEDIWLAYCFDGRIGIASLIPIQEMWINTLDNKNNKYPSLDVCNQAYQKNPYFSQV